MSCYCSEIHKAISQKIYLVDRTEKLSHHWCTYVGKRGKLLAMDLGLYMDPGKVMLPLDKLAINWVGENVRMCWGFINRCNNIFPNRRSHRQQATSTDNRKLLPNTHPPNMETFLGSTGTNRVPDLGVFRQVLYYARG